MVYGARVFAHLQTSIELDTKLGYDNGRVDTCEGNACKGVVADFEGMDHEPIVTEPLHKVNYLSALVALNALCTNAFAFALSVASAALALVNRACTFEASPVYTYRCGLIAES